MKEFRNFQLLCMAWVSLLISPVVTVVTMGVYRLPFPTSISETATIANQSAVILPFALGALALFALSYCIKYSYADKLDKAMTACMAFGFTLVAMQPVYSIYMAQEFVGLFGLNHLWTNIFHYAGALIGFGAFIVWVLICFKKSNKRRSNQTPEKIIRNRWYTALGWAMVASLLLIPLRLVGVEFALVMWLEILILTFGGIACLIKSGFILADKGEDNGNTG